MIDRTIDRTMRALELTLAVAFMLAVVLNFANVVGRYVLGRSILWADEVQIYTMIAFTFLGAVVVTWRRQHLRMDVIANLLPPWMRALLRVLELLLMLAICGFVLFQAQDYTMRMLDIGRTSDTANIPMWIPHGSLAVGFGLIVLVCVWQLARGLLYGFGTQQPPHPEPASEPAREAQS